MFYILQLTLFIVITILLAVLTISLGFFDRHGKRVYRINQLWAWLLLRMGGISLNVEGQENIDASQQYIFMVNHQSNVDIPVIVQSLARFQLRWIAKKELLWVPFFGWAMWATKHITVDRSDPQNAVKSLERARERIAAGISVVVFPEGTRSTDGKLLYMPDGELSSDGNWYILDTANGNVVGKIETPGEGPHDAVMSADGNGNLSGSDTVSKDGTIAQRTFTGTYTVNTNCSGSAKFQFSDKSNTSMDFALGNGGKAINFIDTDNFYTVTPGILNYHFSPEADAIAARY